MNIITWSNTSSIPHQYPLPIPQFIISLRTAATSTTSTTHSFTIPTELPSSNIPKSKFGPSFHPCPTITNTYSLLPHWIQPALWLNSIPTLCYWATKIQKPKNNFLTFAEGAFAHFLFLGPTAHHAPPFFWILGPGAKPFAAAQGPASIS